jgi:hypothetical protein
MNKLYNQLVTIQQKTIVENHIKTLELDIRKKEIVLEEYEMKKMEIKRKIQDLINVKSNKKINDVQLIDFSNCN